MAVVLPAFESAEPLDQIVAEAGVAANKTEPKAKARAATDALNRLKNEPPRFANSTSTLKRARQSRPTLKSKK
jgi:hypothetical protein